MGGFIGLTSDVRCSIAEEARLEVIELKAKDDEQHLVAWGWWLGSKLGRVVDTWRRWETAQGGGRQRKAVGDGGTRRDTAGHGGTRRKFTATCV